MICQYSFKRMYWIANKLLINVNHVIFLGIADIAVWNVGLCSRSKLRSFRLYIKLHTWTPFSYSELYPLLLMVSFQKGKRFQRGNGKGGDGVLTTCAMLIPPRPRHLEREFDFYSLTGHHHGSRPSPPFPFPL